MKTNVPCTSSWRKVVFVIICLSMALYGAFPIYGNVGIGLLPLSF